MTLACASGRMPGQVGHEVCLPNEKVQILIIFLAMFRTIAKYTHMFFRFIFYSFPC